MSKFLLRALSLVATLSLALAAHRACADSVSGVPVRIWADVFTTSDPTLTASLQLYGTFLPMSPGGNGYAATATNYDNTPSDEFISNLGTVHVEAGTTYTLYTPNSNLDSGTVYIVPPPGYAVYMNGMISRATPVGGAVTFRVMPALQGPPGAAGFASTLASAQINWRMSLGFLRNGSEAGSLQMVDPGTSSDWSYLFTPSALNYTSDSAEVYVYQPNNVIRQIIANQVAVDVVTLSANSYEIRCYNPSQIQSYVPCAFSGSPYVVYRIQPGTPDANHTSDPTAIVLQITKETRNITDPFATNVPIARSEVMTLQRTGSWPTYQWVRNSWTVTGQTPLLSTVVQSSGTSQNRTENVTAYGAGNSVAARLTRNYTYYSTCGEVMTSETVGSTNPRTTTFTYNTSASNPGNLGYVSQVNLPGGGWEAYTYYDAGSSTSAGGGNLQDVYRPYVSAPTPPGSLSTGRATSYGFSVDPFNYFSRCSSQYTNINGTTVASDSATYDDTDAGRNDGIVRVTEEDKLYHVTISRNYQENTNDEYKRGQPVSIQQPDGIFKTFTYEIGNWDGATFTPYVVGSGTPITGSRITTVLGTAGSNDTVNLINARSEEHVVIRDLRALPVRQESYVWNNGAWQLTTWTNLQYNFAGLLVSKVSNNGATYTCTWDGQLKTSETDEAGTTTNYSYDVADRVTTSTRLAAGAVPTCTTTYSYDGLANVVQQTIGAAGGEQLVSTKTYDDGDELMTETPAGLGTTSYGYDVANRTVTQTNPDGGTTVTTSALDGRLVSKTGTAVVPEYYTYNVEASGSVMGQEWTQVNYGSASSPRWTKTWKDGLGRTITTTKPGFGTQPQYTEQNTYQDGVRSGLTGAYIGHLYETTKTGVAPTYYQYDVFGLTNRSGTDVNNNGSLDLASNDRINDQNTYYEYYNNAWWARTDSVSYRGTNSSSPTTVSTVRKRLTGFPSGRLSETQTIDVNGNVMIVTTDVDRTNARVTETTTVTGQSWKETKITTAGLVTSATGRDGLTTVTAYDALQRKTSVTDARGNATTYGYVAGSTLVHTKTDATNTVVSTRTYDTTGRVVSTKDAGGHMVYSAYDRTGKTLRQWGDGTYPVEYAFDSYGAKIAMRTFRNPAQDFTTSTWPLNDDGADALNPDPTAWSSGDKTTWAFDPATGLLTSKTDATGKSVSYTYDSTGRLSTRTWARGVATTYAYDPATGDQTGITYSDGTPGLAYTYNRVGESTQVTQGSTNAIVESFDRAISGVVSGDHLDATFFGGRTITYTLNPNADGTKGRILGYSLAAGTTNEQTIGYAYDPSTDRAASVSTSSNGVASSVHAFRYAYLTNSDLISALSVDSSPFAISRTFESNRDVLTSIAGQWSTNTVSEYDYVTNGLMQRTSVKQAGSAFTDYGSSTYQLFTYNGRSELTAANGYLGTDTSQTNQPLPGRALGYAYDSIGNRLSTTRTAGKPADNYTSNALNQIVTKENHSVQVSGTADPTANVGVTGGTGLAARQGRYWSDEATVGNTNGPWSGSIISYVAKNGAGPNGADLLRTDVRTAKLPAATQAFTYDGDGNLTDDGVWTYTWDAENRLIAMQTDSAALAAGFSGQRLEFAYDYLGRRIEKLVRGGWNGSNFTTITLQHRFIYDGWNLIAEYSVSSPSSLALCRSYTWGLDIARTFTEAGGVGALLEIADIGSKKTYFPTYDGNGNVAAILNADTGALAAAYEYSPYGELLRSDAPDPTVADQPFRFSTKYYDQETHLYDYGHRFYDSRNGRFLGRDPIEEKGGIHLYAFCVNNPINKYDILGQDPTDLAALDAQVAVAAHDPNVDPAVLSALMAAQIAAHWHAGGFTDPPNMQGSTAGANPTGTMPDTPSDYMPNLSFSDMSPGGLGFITQNGGGLSSVPVGNVKIGTPIVEGDPGWISATTSVPNANNTLLGQVNLLLATAGGQFATNIINAAAAGAIRATTGLAGFTNTITGGLSGTQGFSSTDPSFQTGQKSGTATVAGLVGVTGAAGANAVLISFTASGIPVFYSGMSTGAAAAAAASRGGYIMANTPAGQWLNNTVEPIVLTTLPNFGPSIMNGVWTGASATYAIASGASSSTVLYFGSGQGAIWVNVEMPILRSIGTVVTGDPGATPGP